ncbi:hypothetical protein FSP39_013101 [Pinctada imbricata]|uniref:RRM domain-containing protein n=1 Tax=Pinctada imbricata TaxID=66713 RepID=A0AA88YPN5_PINIB|nr:hypothetical protein FSP39_013101 [Pinctada imbricata]
MVRETRYLLVGNLPEKVSEEAVLDHFKRYGKIQSVKLHKKESEEGLSATVAFGDIKSASKAYGSENRIEGNLLTTEYSEGSVSGSAVTRIVEPPPVRPSSYSRQFPSRSKGSEDGESFEGRDFHYSPGQYEGRYSQGGGGGGGGYGEEGYQRGRPRERFVARGAFKQYDVRGGYHGRPSYKDQSSQDGFEKPKVPQSPAHSTSHSSSRHSSKRKRKKKKHVSRSESRSRSRSSSSSSSSRSSSDSSGSRSSSGSSRSSSHKRKSQSRSGHIKSYRTESQDSIGSDHGGSKSDLDKTRGVLIKNLPLRSSDTSLRDGLFHDFKKYGKINAVLVTGQGEDRYAIVSYRKTEDAEKAIHNTQGKVFFGMKIRTSLTDGIEVDDNELRPPEAELDEHHPKATRTLFVGNLEKDISNEELRERFSKFGTILDIDVKRQGAISAYAFVQFTDISSVVKVLRELEGEIWGSMKLKLGFGKSMPTTCVWLDNVDQTVQENFLCRQFMRYGQVSHGIIDRIRGRALVFFVNLEMAQYALNEMRNRILNNRKIIIDFASRDCQTEFYEKMEKTWPAKARDETLTRDVAGCIIVRAPMGSGRQHMTTEGVSTSSPTIKVPHSSGGVAEDGVDPGVDLTKRDSQEKSTEEQEEFHFKGFSACKSYEEYGRYPGGPPEGDFDQDLRAYQRERREHGSPSPSQYSDDPYGERYGKYFKYPESYRSGSPVSERAYEDFEYGKPRPDEKYFKERYPEMEFHDRHGYSPEGRSWSRSPTLGMPPKDSYGRNTPPTPMDDEMHDFSSHDNSPEGEAIGKYSEVKEKRRKSGDDFMINEADIAEINRASKYHAGYRKGQESPWRDERYDRKRSYDESFSNEFGQFEQSPHKLDRQISRGSKSSIADSRRDICQKVRKIESKITERLKKGKESSPSSGSSESGELTEGELTKLQSEKQLLLDKLKSLEKDSSNSDLEEGMIEEDRRKSSKRPRLESENPWEKSSKNELTNAKGHPKKSVSYDSTLSLRKQMDHLRKIDETKKTEEKNRNYASNASRTSVDAEGSEAEEFTAMLSPKEISASFKRRKKHETAEEKRSYRLKRGDEEMSSDNEENKNPSRTDSLSSNPVFRRMSSGHSSPRTPVAPHGHDPSGDVLRHSESDLSANEGHSSFTDDSKKKSESATKNHGHRSKHRQKEEHQPTVIPLGDDEPNSELSDPRSRNVISEQMSLPLPQFAELDLNVMMSPDAENSEERMKSESPCFSPPSSGSKNTNSPQRSPSESVSADSQEPIQPEYIPEEGTTNEVPSEDQLLGKTKEKSDFDSDDGFSDNSDHMDNFESDDKLSLEERIRRLDEKLRAVPTPSTSTKPVSDISASLSINSGSKGEACNSSLARTALYSKFRISKRQDASGNGIDNKAEGSDITHTVVPRKISIFDQDAKRLEQISEKYSPKTNLSSVEDTHVSMPVMTKAAVKEMPLATLPGSLTGRLGNSAAFPTLSVNTTTANQTGLKPEEMFSSPTSEISTPSPAFNSSQEKPIWQTENFTGSPHLVEPAVTAYSLVPKTNFSEQINNSGNLHSNSSKEDLISKPFVTPAVKKQMGLSNLSDANSVFTNSVVHEEKLHSPKESEKLSPKGDAKSSPNRNEQTVSPKLSPKPFSKMDSNVNSFVETNSSIKSDLISDLHTSDSNKLTNSMDKVNSHSVQSVNEPMEEDTPSILCDTKSNSAPRTKNMTRDSSISKVNGSKDHNKKVNETVEDVLGLNTPVLGKRKAELDEKPKSSSKDKSSSKETVLSVNMASESELSEKDDKTQEPDVKKVKLAKSESSSSEGEKVDGKNKVKNKDSQKKDKENKKKEACEDDLVKKEKNNGEKKDKDRDGSSSKGSASKTSSGSGEKTGSSSKSSSKSHDKSQAASKSSSVKAEDKVIKPSTDKNKSSKSEDKSKADGKSESKSKSDDKTKTEKSSDGTTKKQSDKKSEHKKEHKSSSSAKTSDVTKVKDKDKSAKDGQKGKSKDDQAAGSKSVKSEKTGHGNSDKSTKDGVNKNKKESSEKSKGEGCKPKEEQKERSQSFDSPSKSKDPPQQDTKERSQSMTESEKVKDKSNPSGSDTSKESTSKAAEGKQSSSDKTAKEDNKDKSGVKADDSSDRKSEVKAEQKTEQHTEAKSEQKTDSSENKSGNGDKSSDKSDKNGDKGGDKSGDKSGNSDGKHEMKGFGSDDRKHEKKKSSHSDSSKSFKKSEKSSSEKSEKSSSEKSEKSSSEKSQKSSSHKMPSKSEFDKDKDKSQKNDREKSKGHSSSSSLSEKEKEKKSKSSEKAKKVEKENKEVKTVSTSSSKKKPETPAVQTMKSPEYTKKPPVEDDFDWDAWQEPYVSMYDKVKRRSTIKDQERERERELEKTRERLDKLQEKRQNKKASKQKSGKPNFRSDYTESEFTDEDDITGKSKKKSSTSNNNKKKAPQIYSSSSESDYDFEEPLFPSQKKAQAKPKVQSIPKKKKKASILDIYSSDSEESSDSSFGIPRSVSKKKPKTPKRDQSMESDDVFGLKQKPVEIKKKPKKETPQKPSIKSPARKNFNEIFSSSDSDSDTDPAIQESPKPVQRSKSVKDKLDKPGNKIYSSSESDSMDEMFTPPKKMVLTESTKEKASKNIKTPKKHDNNNKKKPNNIFDDSRAVQGLGYHSNSIGDGSTYHW